LSYFNSDLVDIGDPYFRVIR